MPGLNPALGSSRFAVVEFVARDPADPERFAVFVDAELLSRLVLLPTGQRELLAEREAARLRGDDEDVVQALPLPPDPALLALVREKLGSGVVGGLLEPAQHRRVALVLARLLGGARGPGGPVVVDWRAVAAELEPLGLGWLRGELVCFQVFDVRGRRWNVQFTAVRAEVVRLRAHARRRRRREVSTAVPGGAAATSKLILNW